jgi:hypothetical protein
MSLLSDIKLLLSRYLKNHVLVIAGAYILWKFINYQKNKNKKEFLSERIIVYEKDIIFDKKLNKYILIKNNRVFSSDKKEDLINLTR